jgi:BolA-like protein 1
MSGNTAADIQKVDAQFIQRAKISQSLTPGRNNGFLNMLRVMKQKAMELDTAAREQEAEAKSKESTTTTTVNVTADSSSSTTTSIGVVLAVENDPSHGPKYNAICQALAVLQPTVLNLMDNSHQHAGHAGNDMEDGESHFELEIVAPAFEGLSLVKRHKLIYMVLGDIMPQIHALQIRSLTPDELQRSNTSSS